MDLKRVLSFPPYPGEYLHPVVYACTAVLLLCLLISSTTYILHHRVIRISRSGWHTLLNFLLRTALSSAAFTGGVNQTSHPFICQSVGIVLHYASLSSMLWLSFTARSLCRDVSRAPAPALASAQPKTKPTVLGLYLVSDGVPLVIVGVTAAISREHYGNQGEALYCWMAWEPSLGGFYGPIAFLVLVMFLYFLCTFIQLKRHPDRKYELKAVMEEQRCLESHPCRSGGCAALTAGVSVLANEHSFKAQLRAAAFTLFLCLATWALGALAVSQGHFLDMVFSCLYGASSVTLGLFLLIQHCAKRDDVWQCWWACCPSKAPPEEVNGHGHTHRRGPDRQKPRRGHLDSPYSGKQPLLSPHLHTPATCYTTRPAPQQSPTPNHEGPCCMALHGPAPSPLMEAAPCPRPQSLPDELPQSSLPLQSCLKDRTQSRSFSRPRPRLRDCRYRMLSSSMDAVPQPCPSPHPHPDLQLPCPGPHPHPDLQLPCPSPHPHPDLQLPCPGPHPHSDLQLPCPSPHPHPDLQLPCPGPHPDLQLPCPGPHPHPDLQLPCPSPHPDLQLPCPSPHLDQQLASFHSLHRQSSCQSMQDPLPACHSLHAAVDTLSCHEGHTCPRHVHCPPTANPFSASRYPDPPDHFGAPCQQDPETYSCGSNQEEDTMLHLEMKQQAPPRQTLPRPRGPLSRRGTFSRNGSLQEDFLFSSDTTGNIRTGPWKNETTV